MHMHMIEMVEMEETEAAEGIIPPLDIMITGDATIVVEEGTATVRPTCGCAKMTHVTRGDTMAHGGAI